MKAIGINDFLARKFETLALSEAWQQALGTPERNFKMIISGPSGSGKTDFAIKLSKELASVGIKVHYNSFEEGISCTLQAAVRRNNLAEVSGKVMFGHKETVDELITRLAKPNSAGALIIDSRDYMNLTTEQFKLLKDRFPKKAIILLCWEAGGKPKGEYAKAIEYMCDIKVRVYKYTAYPRSRFGGNKPYTIWNKQVEAGEQLPMFPQENAAADEVKFRIAGEHDFATGADKLNADYSVITAAVLKDAFMKYYEKHGWPKIQNSNAQVIAIRSGDKVTLRLLKD
ncbi:MAG: hypothetical protein RL660_467 [Bacteroidota bacterium]|jgi:hypothetical protein